MTLTSPMHLQHHLLSSVFAQTVLQRSDLPDAGKPALHVLLPSTIHQPQIPTSLNPSPMCTCGATSCEATSCV